jgi:hypothetical protein
MAMLFGAAAGTVYGLLRTFVRNPAVRNVSFILLCIAFSLYGVKDLLFRPRMMFVGLTVLFALAMEFAGARKPEWRQPEIA